jgi:ribosome biogenesis GTPase A
MARYEFESLPEDALQLLDMLGAKRGCLRKGGVVDYDRVSAIFVNELKAGKFGRLTLETPEMMEKELSEAKNNPTRIPRSATPKKKKKTQQERNAKKSKRQR